MSEKKSKILLAEDDLNLGMLLVDYLETEGFDVKLCKDGELALRAFENNRYDLCLLDVMMPKMDGYGFMREMKKEPKWRAIPVVVLTAREMTRDIFVQEGVKEFIVKPYDPDELYRVVSKYL